MSILASLVNAYDRLPNAPPFGFSSEKICVLISLNEDGSVANVTDLREGEGKKKQVPAMLVPQPVKRTAGISPNFLWDKTSYVLGVTAAEGKRTADEHAAFIKRHSETLEGTDDAGLKALLGFLQLWTPDQFIAPDWREEMKDQNVAFTLESERLAHVRLHDRPAAKALWARVSAEGDSAAQICLVTGNSAPVARLHPSVKGVWGAQSSGAALVSFNLDAFESYGHEQGDNAPVSEAAAFAYTTVLNRFLERDSGHRVQIGDASTVFWADASDTKQSEMAEAWGAWMLDSAAAEAADEKFSAKEIENKLKQIRQGEQLSDVEPKLAEGVRFCVLGLAPNAARLSIRFFFEDDFGVLTTNYVAYVKDMEFEPWPKGHNKPAIRSCVLRTAPARKDRNNKITYDKEQQSPLLAGEFLRAILTGNKFPASLLPHLVTRIRSDHILDSIRIALIKGLLVRTMRIENRLPPRPDGTPMEDYLVRSDPNDPNPARRLGRLFAVIERTQLASLGDEVNATVKDKFMGAAAATPRHVFVALLDLSRHHTKRLRNGHSDAQWIKASAERQGLPLAIVAKKVGAKLDADIGRLVASFNNGFPAQHSSEEQAFFLVGYYQERFGSKADPDSGDAPEVIENAFNDGEE